ncbi:MAG: hypothetical protein KKA62_04855 [Nanoarchaeota archaeon]|nr:hypothetical protein [Nanoarchaeota archaeon]MBU1644294.1 hypothetical protein [Nanoarchaeota archaeon]MBU1977250.1 hypothetical protein [Nanoarchaeota archaeon]
MEEKQIIKLSFFVIVLGVGFLFFYAEEFNLAVVKDIETVTNEEEVHLRGRVNSLKTTEKATFLEVEGEKIVKTNVIFFPEEDLFLQEGDFVEIVGTVEEYKGEKEIVANKVILK